MRKIEAVVHKEVLKGFEEKQKDLTYWLSRSPQERIMAVTTLVRQSLLPGQRMDRTASEKRKMES